MFNKVETASREGEYNERAADLIFSSKEIKRLIMERLEESRISLALMCRDIGVSPKDFKRYYLNTHGKMVDETKKKGLTHIGLRKVLNYLNMDIKITLITGPFTEEIMKQKRESLEYKFIKDKKFNNHQEPEEENEYRWDKPKNQ